MGINSYYFKNIESKLIGVDYYDFKLNSDNQGLCLDYATKCSDHCNAGYNVITDKMVLWFDVNQTGSTIDGSSIKSLVEWEDYKIKPISGFTLCDFGLTGVDNGRYDQLSGITVNITSGDTKVILFPVTGYTISESGTTGGKYSYPWVFKTGTTTNDGCDVGNTICLNGGFYQGYFKLDFLEPTPKIQSITGTCGITETLIPSDSEEFKYDLLPTEFKDGWSMETWIKWDNTECKDSRDAVFTGVTMTKESSESCLITVNLPKHTLKIGDPIIISGSTDSGFDTDGGFVIDSFTLVYDVLDTDTFQYYQHFTKVSTGTTNTATVIMYEKIKTYEGVKLIRKNNQFTIFGELVGNEFSVGDIIKLNNYSDFPNYSVGNIQSYFRPVGLNNEPCNLTEFYNDNYVRINGVSGDSFTYNVIHLYSGTSNFVGTADIHLYKIKKTDDILTLNDNYINNRNFFFYIGTRAENKFRNVFSGETGLKTCGGIPLSPEQKFVLDTGGQSWFTRNSLRLPRCWQCCDDVVDNTGTTKTKYCDELSENALGFRITDEGKVGYRKMTVSVGCYNNKERITGTTMEEGYSDKVIFKDKNKWYHVVVTYTENSVKHGLPAGVLKFWVNGKVVYRVKDFIGLKLRALDEWSDKQLGVPFNISWGGGTQGLLESQTFNGPDVTDYGLELENNFAGTFEGEISQLRFYEKPLNLLEIRNNLFIDCPRYCVYENFGGSIIIDPNSEFCDDCGRGNYNPFDC
jgi:hypothetical protein